MMQLPLFSTPLVQKTSRANNFLRVAAASALLFGASTLAPSSASAAVVATTSCFFGTPNPVQPPPNCGDVTTLTVGDKSISDAVAPLFPPNSGGNFVFTQTDGPGAPDGNPTNDFYSVTLNFLPDLSGTQGPYLYGYQLNILPAFAAQGYVFDRVALEVNSVGSTTTVIKGVADDTGSTLLGELQSINGVPVGGDPGRSFTISGDYTSIVIADLFELVDSPPDVAELASITNRFTQRLSRVPAPLPLLGGAVAFGYSRKLRKRIKSNQAAA